MFKTLFGILSSFELKICLYCLIVICWFAFQGN
jgi:hypothetical protein